MPELPILNVNGQPVTNADVIIRLKADGLFKKALTDVIADTAIRSYAEKEGIIVSEDDLQGYADKKRVELGLISVKDTESYFSRLGINIDQWAEYLESDLYRLKVKEHLLPDEAVTDYFNENKGLYKSASLHRILVSDEATIEEIKLQLEEEDGDFTELAKDNSIDEATASSGGYMGIISRGILNPELEARIFASKEGSLTGPVKEENGWALYKTGRINDATLTDSLKERIKDGLFEMWQNNLMLSSKIETL